MEPISSSAETPAQKRRISSGSFFRLPNLFVGFRAKGGSPELEPAARSPTSPLDFKLLSGIGSYLLRSPRSPKSWDSSSSKVGLGIVDSLADPSCRCPSGRFLGVAENSKNIVLGSKTTMARDSPLRWPGSPRSLPNDFWVPSNLVLESPGIDFRRGELGKIRSLASSDDDFQPESKLSPANGGCGSADEIELSEDYTCIISRGPNPTKTHIFGDFVLESHSIDDTSTEEQCRWTVSCVDAPSSPPLPPSALFLSSCFSCEKELEEGRDIYMYRGEKAFCSSDCREKQIAIEEEEPAKMGRSK